MKKIFIALLALLYLGVSTGLAINIHYCMGKVSSVGFIGEKDKCGKCGMKKTANGCCKDEYKIVKLDDAHKLFGNSLVFYSAESIPDTFRSIFDTGFFKAAFATAYNSHSPPASAETPVYILNCVFRI